MSQVTIYVTETEYNDFLRGKRILHGKYIGEFPSLDDLISLTTKTETTNDLDELAMKIVSDADAVKRKYPNKNNREISKTIGNMWRDLSNEEKKKYRNQATDLKNSYFQKKKRVKNGQSVNLQDNYGTTNQNINIDKTSVININNKNTPIKINNNA
ncbi:7316_t:CDS:2 [Entrophospora sp. SA101]|nr:7316_t:CDS:2 [Entrophospora sp. SA101]CAJ0873350.1 1800_t:CDS:2 [Entrophospora sp. SA101]